MANDEACTALAAVVARSITRQLGMEPAEAMDFANRIADGDLSQQLQPQDPHTRSLAHVQALAVHRGHSVGLGLAEAFMLLLRSVPERARASMRRCAPG